MPGESSLRPACGSGTLHREIPRCRVSILAENASGSFEKPLVQIHAEQKGKYIFLCLWSEPSPCSSLSLVFHLSEGQTAATYRYLIGLAPSFCPEVSLSRTIHVADSGRCALAVQCVHCNILPRSSWAGELNFSEVLGWKANTLKRFLFLLLFCVPFLDGVA